VTFQRSVFTQPGSCSIFRTRAQLSILVSRKNSRAVTETGGEVVNLRKHFLILSSNNFLNTARHHVAQIQHRSLIAGQVRDCAEVLTDAGANMPARILPTRLINGSRFIFASHFLDLAGRTPNLMPDSQGSLETPLCAALEVVGMVKANVQRHLISRPTHRRFRTGAHQCWNEATAAAA
jgi:hypothetical protein